MGRRRSDPAASSGVYLLIDELYDGVLAPAATLVVATNGEYMMCSTGNINTEVYIDTVPVWQNFAAGANEIASICGEANRLRFNNAAAGNRWLTVVRIR